MFYHLLVPFLVISAVNSTDVCSSESKVEGAFYNRFKRAAAVFIIGDTYFEYDFEQEKLVGTGNVLNAWPNITLPISFADSIKAALAFIHDNRYWTYRCNKSPYICRLVRTGIHIGVYGNIIADTEAMFIYQENMGFYKPGEKDLQHYSSNGKSAVHYLLRRGKRMDCIRELTPSNQTEVNVTLDVNKCTMVDESNLRYENYLKLKSEEHIEDLSASYDQTTNTTDFVIFTSKYMRYTLHGNPKVVPLRELLGCRRVHFFIFVVLIFVIIVLALIPGAIWLHMMQQNRLHIQEHTTVARV